MYSVPVRIAVCGCDTATDVRCRIAVCGYVSNSVQQ